jgi:hypothetical protein
MPCAFDVLLPERLGLDLFPAEAAKQLAGIRVRGERMIDATRGSLLAEKCPHISHWELLSQDDRGYSFGWATGVELAVSFSEEE